MRNFLDHIVAHRSGALRILLLAAFLEAYGDSTFQTALYRFSRMSRTIALLSGTASLGAYGLAVNTPRWDFGELLGVYVVLFFLLVQVVASVSSGRHPYCQLSSASLRPETDSRVELDLCCRNSGEVRSCQMDCS